MTDNAKKCEVRCLRQDVEDIVNFWGFQIQSCQELHCRCEWKMMDNDDC